MHYYYTIITFMTRLYILWHETVAKCRQNRRENQRKMHVGAHTVGVMKAKSPRVCISSLCQWHGLRVHGISTWCTDGIAVSAMTVHARPRPPHSGACCDGSTRTALRRMLWCAALRRMLWWFAGAPPLALRRMLWWFATSLGPWLWLADELDLTASETVNTT